MEQKNKKGRKIRRIRCMVCDVPAAREYLDAKEVKMKKYPFSIKLKFHIVLTPPAGPARDLSGIVIVFNSLSIIISI